MDKTMPMVEKRTGLRELAQAAQGFCGQEMITGECSQELADFRAEAHPGAVLSLISQIETMEQAIQIARIAIDSAYEITHGDCPWCGAWIPGDGRHYPDCKGQLALAALAASKGQ